MRSRKNAMTADLTDPIFTDEDAAWAHFESIRWPEGRNCPHCGVIGQSDASKGKTTRRGLYNCRACDKPFTATMGTVYEGSHIPMHKWLLGTHLMASSKKGISAHQLWRMLGFGSYRTAWFMSHRIREAMREGELAPMGGGGTPVEADETYIGRKPGAASKMAIRNMNTVVTIVDRATGRASSKVLVENLSAASVTPILTANIAKEARLMTDEGHHYYRPGRGFAAHATVNHGAGEYVRISDPTVHINTVEGYFSIFKRGMKGVYQHCGPQHLHRYMAEFDFRYSHRVALGVDDKARAARAVAGAVGKRLTYRQPDNGEALGLTGG
jgi:transposase-like protein